MSSFLGFSSVFTSLSKAGGVGTISLLFILSFNALCTGLAVGNTGITGSAATSGRAGASGSAAGIYNGSGVDGAGADTLV